MPDESTTETTDQSSTETTTEAEKAPKMVPLKELIQVRTRAKAAEEELATLKAADEERKRQDLSEVERLKADNDKLLAQLTETTTKAAKDKALADAIGAVGEGWSVAHAVDALKEAAADIVYDAKAFPDKIKRLVEAAKRPLNAGKPGMTGTPSKEKEGSQDNRPAGRMTPADLAKMAAEDPNGFAEAMRQSRIDSKNKWVGTGRSA